MDSSKLKKLHNYMIENAIPCTIFKLNFNKKPLQILYLVQEYELYLSSCEHPPLVIKFTINNNFYINSFIADQNKYENLRKYLEITSSGNVYLSPKLLWEDLLKKFPTECTKQVKTSVKAEILNYANTSSDDPRKIYFSHWMQLPDSKSVSPLNFRKTQSITSKEIAVKLKNNNISSCWQINSENENLENINNYEIFL